MNYLVGMLVLGLCSPVYAQAPRQGDAFMDSPHGGQIFLYPTLPPVGDPIAPRDYFPAPKTAGPEAADAWLREWDRRADRQRESIRDMEMQILRNELELLRMERERR